MELSKDELMLCVAGVVSFLNLEDDDEPIEGFEEAAKTCIPTLIDLVRVGEESGITHELALNLLLKLNQEYQNAKIQQENA